MVSFQKPFARAFLRHPPAGPRHRRAWKHCTRMARNAAGMAAKFLRHAGLARYHALGCAMGSILRFAFAGMLGLLILFPLWRGNAVDALATGFKSGALPPRLGLQAGFDSGVIARLQEVRSEIRGQQCARGAQSYCLLGRCWTVAAPRDCAGPAKAGAGPYRLSVDR